MAKKEEKGKKGMSKRVLVRKALLEGVPFPEGVKDEDVVTQAVALVRAGHLKLAKVPKEVRARVAEAVMLADDAREPMEPALELVEGEAQGEGEVGQDEAVVKPGGAFETEDEDEDEAEAEGVDIVVAKEDLVPIRELRERILQLQQEKSQVGGRVVYASMRKRVAKAEIEKAELEYDAALGRIEILDGELMKAQKEEMTLGRYVVRSYKIPDGYTVDLGTGKVFPEK